MHNHIKNYVGVQKGDVLTHTIPYVQDCAGRFAMTKAGFFKTFRSGTYSIAEIAEHPWYRQLANV